MERSNQWSIVPSVGRLQFGIVALAIGIACILSLAYAPGQTSVVDAVAAILGVASLTAGTLTIGSSSAT